MKVTTLLFALLFLVAQTGNAQTTRTARMDVPKASKGLSDAEILVRADEIKYRALHQDYSNIANALADSKLEVNDRLTALNRLTETYFGNMPETVTLPANLLKPDGSAFSAKEMGDFMTRLTKKKAPDTASKSFDSAAMACIVDYYQQVWIGSELAQIIPDYVIVAHPGAVSTCSMAHIWLYAPVSLMPAH